MSAKTATAPRRLAYHPCRPGCTEGANCYERLPFIPPHGSADRGFWSVPAVGDITGGDIIGRAMALAYMRHIHFSDVAEQDNFLSMILESMAERMAELPPLKPGVLGDYRARSLRGQMSGFLSVIELRLSGVGVKRKHLESVTEQQIEDMAAKGLNYDEEAGTAYWKAADLFVMEKETFKPEPIPGLW